MLSGIIPSLLAVWAGTVLVASGEWIADVDALTRELAPRLGAKATVFVQQPVEESQEHAYYPFLDRVRGQLIEGLANQGLVVKPDIGGVGAFLLTQYTVKAEGLMLNAQVRQLGTGNVIAGKTVFIEASRLESGWDSRTLRDVAYELVDKMLLCLLGEESVTAEMGEITGTKNDQGGLVSVFSRTIQGYISEELGKWQHIKVLAPEVRARALGKVMKLRGEFMEDGQDVVLRVVLLDTVENRELEKANASTRFPLASLPPKLDLFPPNSEEAIQSTDPPRPLSEEAREVRVVMWTDKPDGIYRPEEEPSFFVQAQEDCYIRAYYIQSDGRVYQIFPTLDRHTDWLPKDQPVDICKGPPHIKITDDTLGQEFVKVFASRTSIDDSLVDKDIVKEYGFYKIQSDYAGLRENLGARWPSAPPGPLRPTAELSLVVVPLVP